MPDKAVSMDGIFSIPDSWIDQEAMAEAFEKSIRSKEHKLPAFTTKARKSGDINLEDGPFKVVKPGQEESAGGQKLPQFTVNNGKSTE